MDKPRCPEDLIIEIILKFTELEVERKEWLRLRLVNSMSSTSSDCCSPAKFETDGGSLELFNSRILFTIFVVDPRTFKYSRASHEDKQFYGTQWEQLSPKFATLYRFWWLQGQLVKFHREGTHLSLQSGSSQHFEDHIWWGRIVNESALLVTEYTGTAGSNMIDSLIFTGFASSIGSPTSVTLLKARELICDVAAWLVDD